MPNKLKILFNSEAHYLASGFSKIYKELITRLHNTNKYEVAEFATYGSIQDHRNKASKWKFYCNHVLDDDPRVEKLKENPKNQFGLWRFETVLLDFKPDVVFDLRDSYMYDYETRSPFRKYFHHILMPTCDSDPQKNEWISDLIKTDAVFTYTKYAYDIIQKEGGGKINLIDVTTPCVNLDTYSPVKDIRQHKTSMGMDPDTYIVGTVMRNQKRKLFPDLLKSFRLFLNKCEKDNPELGQKTFLYLHTSYPDQGWEIPDFMKEFGLCNKCLFTYKCNKCSFTFTSFFQESLTICPKCNTQSAVIPTVGSGASEEFLINIYKSFDLYIQYANCEGLGYPVIEAAACGIPIACTNYSGMADFPKFIDVMPINIKKKFFDMDNTAYRVYPDNEHCADIIYNFLSMPSPMRKQVGFKTRKLTEKCYNWDTFIKKFENYFDNIKLTGSQGKWDSPLKLVSPHQDIPKNLNNTQFLEWAIKYVACDDSLLNTYQHMFMLRLLNDKIYKSGHYKELTTKEGIKNQFNTKAQANNFWERVRCGLVKMPQEDYIVYAEMFK